MLYDLYKLQHRKFEEFLEVVFQNNGYKTLLGSGSNDGGVDLRLYMNDVISESITLVQAKCYKSTLTIDLQAVQALTAVVDDQKANRGLFVTTSRYLPCAKKFAARQGSKIQLATSKEVAQWCDLASHKIRENKSKLIEIEHIKNLLQGKNIKGLEGKIFHAIRNTHDSFGDYSTSNEYAMLIKETKGAALLVSIPSTKHQTNIDFYFGGTELPDTRIESFLKIKDVDIFRVKKTFDENNELKFLWGRELKYFIWNNQLNEFSIY